MSTTVPSISADDSAGVLQNKLGYWRGFVWGPLSILTYWSLAEYAHVSSTHVSKLKVRVILIAEYHLANSCVVAKQVPAVRHGRQMMSKQLSTMMARVQNSSFYMQNSSFLCDFDTKFLVFVWF